MTLRDDDLDFEKLLPPSGSVDESSMFHQEAAGPLAALSAGSPATAAAVSGPDAFSSLDLPEFSHFPIEDGNFGDLEFLDLASDRLLDKSKSKYPGQFSDIYFNSIATPSGYCSANYLTEEANRLTLLLSESSDR
jgi:hypothetical protein